MTQKLKSVFTKENWKTFGIINLGVLLLSLGVYFFKFPNNFTTGGVSGVSIIVGRLVPWITPATMMAVINVILLIVGFLVIGKEFGFLTCYCSLMFSAETWVLERFLPMTAPFTDQPLLELCFAIFLPAVGSALLFNRNASSGGTDVIAMILKKYTGLQDIGKALLVSDGVIAVAACFVFGMKTGLFSILGLFLKAFVVDSVIESINLCKCFSIVTEKDDVICDYIIHTLNHSSTVVEAQGAFSHEKKKLVMTTCRRGEAVKLRKKVKELDPNAFMYITNSSEIIGKGFRSV